MWKIHRYYLKEIAVNAVLTFTVLFGIALVSLLYKGIRMLSGGNLLDAALTTLLLAADLLPHLMTFSLLFATVLTFARASQEREITAIRALGISPRVPMVSALLIGLFCSIIATWSHHYATPWAHYHKYRVVADVYRSQIMNFLIKDQDRIELDKKGSVMTWQRKELQGDRVVYCDVSIYTRSKTFGGGGGGTMSGEYSLVIVDKVWFSIDEDSPIVTMHTRGLYRPATGMAPPLAAIKMNIIQILKGRGDRTSGDRDLRSDSLLSEVYRGVHSDPLAARYTVHRRACFSLMPFLLAPIGFCIGVFARERGRMLALSFCMIPLALVYLSDFLGESALRYYPYSVLGWLPAAVLVLAGAPFCWRLLRV